MKAVGQNVFILPDWDNEDKSESGLIHLPKVRLRELPRVGTVKAVADSVTCDFKVGDKVVYDYHKQQLETVPGEPLTLARVKVKDVLAKFV